MENVVRIIVIDDEPKITKLLKIILLDGLECEVHTYNDANAAFEALQLESFDVISLDHRMPGMTGTEIVKRLRSGTGPNSLTPVVLLTAFRDEAEHLQLELLRDLMFLDKPIEDEHYIVNIKIAIQMKRNQIREAS